MTRATTGSRASGARTRWTGTLFTGPAWLLLAAVVLVPLVTAVYASTTDESLVSLDAPRFVGGANFGTQVLHGDFWSALVVTVLVIVLSLVVQLPLGLLLAQALARPLRGRTAFRAAVTLPMMLTPVAVGLMWRFLADPDLGVIRWVAAHLLPGARPNLPGSELGALGLVVAVNSWINVPFVTLLLLAGLLGVPDELYEAAALDGAGRLQTGRYVTLPTLAPVLGVTCLLRVAADYRMFDLVYTVTRGGPGDATRNLSMLAYQQGLGDFQIGRACAIAVAMAVLALPAYLLFSKVTRP